MPNTPLLDKIKNPQDLKKLQVSELKTLAEELRAELVDAVSVTGGHLGAGLGVVELTIAIHYLFDTPKDRLVWDVGHQAYPHKILTERRDRIRTLRKGGGLSGFTKRSESIYDDEPINILIPQHPTRFVVCFINSKLFSVAPK